MNVPVNLNSLADLQGLSFDSIIDVRAPSEFAEDHIPGAINLPVLSDEERALVGTVYKQQSPFQARKIGAALVARNSAAHIENALGKYSGGWRPLTYCWRGGQRSGAFAAILREIGWQVDTLGGGYKTWRRLVVKAMYDACVPHRLVLIDGGTGTGKTRLLHHLEAQGAQVIDLEDRAAHRGSLFGPISGAQPSQKAFEGGLALTLSRMAPEKPVFLEAESSRIGRCIVPPAIWKAMITAPRFHLRAPLDARVTHLLDNYGDILQDPARLDTILGKLVVYHGHATIEAWRKLAAAGSFAELTAELVSRHYDPRYTSPRHSAGVSDEQLDLPDLTEATLARVAAAIMQKNDQRG